MFNKAQLNAINHYKGPAMVLAGPGSGKTTVITHRIKNLIEQYNISPSQILVITFTKMAATEMKERFLKLTNNRYLAVTFGTFHAIYFTILKHAYNYNAANIIRQSKQIEFITSLIDNYELEFNNKEEFVQKILSEISFVKGQRIKEYTSVNCPPKVFEDIFNKYNQMMARKRLIDFDDMMGYCYELFDKRKDVLEAWQNKYEFILIDEFQDISDIQFDVVRQLAAKYRNIFIVGDDDQSIYGFRGARPQIMMGFQNIYKDLKRIDMNTNYRSTSNIVNAAKSLIDINKERLYKDINTINPIGDKVYINICENTGIESDYVVKQIKQLIESKEDIKYSDICILVRTNSGAGLIVQSLVKECIPFAIKEKLLNVFEHWIAKDIIAYIKISLGSRDRSDYIRIINKPLRYLNRMAFSSQPVDISCVRRFYADKLYMQDIIDNFVYDIKLISNMTPFAVINYIRKGIGYDNYLKEYAVEYNADYEELERIIEEITDSVKAVKSWDMWFDYIEKYTRKLSENGNDNSDNNMEIKDEVTICTMHASKGLEYKVVFVLDVNENVIPYKRAVLESEIEEERRLLYVAMTRAKVKLYLCCVNKRYDKKMEISRFIGELNKNFIEINKLE